MSSSPAGNAQIFRLGFGKRGLGGNRWTIQQGMTDGRPVPQRLRWSVRDAFTIGTGYSRDRALASPIPSVTALCQGAGVR